MNSTQWVRQVLATVIVAACIAFSQAHAETRSTAQSTASVVMLSDLHFDPYRDPAKLPLLRSAPVNEWANILSSPASEKQAEDFAAVQKTCNTRGIDSSWALISASLHAAHEQQPKPLFVTVSGDLLVHHFDCRMQNLLPKATPKDVSDFAEKTVAFLALQFHDAFPGVPIYLALGNNDSGCEDYVENRGSDFLHSAGKSFASDITNAGATMLGEFSDEGDYNVSLPAPMANARLIVLQDLFEAAGYKTCDGKPDGGKAAAAQISWLQTQLTEARRRHQHVWVIAHIPPGIDVYTNFHKYILNASAICEVTAPSTYLGSDALSHTLTDFADVVQLAVFAHTHMDEMKLLHNDSGGIVAAKLVPSISPVNGNSPSFIMAQVNPHTAVMMDYRVITSRNADWSVWREAYRYSLSYGMTDYSAKSVQQLTAKLAADKSGNSELSRTYEKWFFPGDVGLFALGLHQIWPAYSCAMVEDGGPAFHQCMCGPGK